MPRKPDRRRVCFVTGTRAEFGLMTSTLRLLRGDPRIDLQIIATGTHTQTSRGYTLRDIRREGWHVDAVVRWPDDSSPTGIATNTGRVSAKLAALFESLDSEIVVIVGDRVEAFAAATAAHISGRIVAHIHGGDRAMGQVDDALRHAISKLAHVHFAATRESGDRLFAMGEDRRRIHVVGAPGVDGIRSEAASRPTLTQLGLHYRAGAFLLLLLHPTDDDDEREAARTRSLIGAVRKCWRGQIVALLPNSDPGSAGVVAALKTAASRGEVDVFTHVSRAAFLGLMRDGRLLIGNSSAGIIEAGSFGTRVVDVGARQYGRERGGNVCHADWSATSLRREISVALGARAKAGRSDNPYDLGGAGAKISRILATLRLDGRLRRKVIRY